MSTKEEADVINDAMATPAPEMEDAPLLQVELLIGLQVGDEWVTEALVKELTGEDEEALASLDKKDSTLLFTEYLSAILALGVVEIGGTKIKGDKKLLNRLALPDRDVLYLGIMRATYGDTREIRSSCLECGESNDILIELDKDFPVHEPDFDPQEGIKVKGRRHTYTLRLPTGQDMVDLQSKDMTNAEFNTRLLANCLVFGENAPKDRVAWAKSLNIADRKVLIDRLLTTKVGPSMREVKAQCASCEEEIRIVLDWASLLLG